MSERTHYPSQKIISKSIHSHERYLISNSIDRSVKKDSELYITVELLFTRLSRIFSTLGYLLIA